MSNTLHTSDERKMPYLPHTDEDRQAMLAAIGVAGVDDLLADIPAEVRSGPLDLPAPLDEAAMMRHLDHLAAQNRMRPALLRPPQPAHGS